MPKLKYRRNADLRLDIAGAVGIVDRARYAHGKPYRKGDLYRIAREVGDPPDDMTLEELYRWLCDELDRDFAETGGCQWRLSRATLKALHRAVVDDA
jgi:hypothetical protein